MATVVMVRTVCCESYRCGNRCSICPNSPRNREAVQNYREKAAVPSFGKRFTLPAHVMPPSPAPKAEESFIQLS
jgi:hypothetical protein